MSVSINGSGSISGIDQGLNVTGIITATGGLNVTGGDVTLTNNLLIPQDKKIHLEGGSGDDYNAIWKADAENTVFVTSRFNMANIIDSNNDDTNSYWSIRKDGTTLSDSSELMRVQSNGSIGIGTNVPDTLLHIQGSTNSFDAITLSGGTNKRKNTIGVNNADNLVISVDEDAEGNGSNFRLRVDGAETLRSTFSRIGIGTENDSGVGTCRVYVYNNDVPAYPVLRLENTGGTIGTGDLLHMKTARGDGTINADLVKLDLYDDTEIFKVDNGGTVHFRSGCGSGTFAALPVYGVRAWINFSNSGGNTTRGSGGVLTRSDDGEGAYTITFDFTMPDSDFFAIADSGNNSGGTSNRARCTAFSRTTTTASFINYDTGAGTAPTQGTDRQVNYVAFIR
jgi:hypothetical protein